MAVRKVSANFLALCVVCLIATSVVQFCEGSDELCPNEEELLQMFDDVNITWEEGRCSGLQKQICVNSSGAFITTTTSSSDTTLDTSISTQADPSSLGENTTKVLVLCAFCQPGYYVSNDSDTDTTTTSSEDTTPIPVDTSSSSSETASSPTTSTLAASSPSDTTSSPVQTTGRQYRCRPCTPGVRDVACPVPSPDGPDNSKYIIIGASLGGGVLIVIIVITVVCCRQGKCCCQRGRGTHPPASLQVSSVDGRNKDPENVEDDSRINRKGRYTPMPGSQTGPHSSNAEDSEVDNLPMAPPPPTGKPKSNKRFSVKIQQLRPWKRSTKKRKEEEEEKKDGGGYITMNNVVSSRLSSPSSEEPIYQNEEEAMASGNPGEEIYQNEDQQEIYENQGMEDDQEIYENEEAIQASGGQLPRQLAATVGGEETYYNVADEDYENPDGRRK